MNRFHLAWCFLRLSFKHGSHNHNTRSSVFFSILTDVTTIINKNIMNEISIIHKRDLDSLYKKMITKAMELEEMTRTSNEYKYDLKEPFKIHRILNEKETSQVGKYPTLEAAIEDATVLAAANPTSKFFVYSPGDIYQADIPVKSTPFPK